MSLASDLAIFARGLRLNIPDDWNGREIRCPAKFTFQMNAGKWLAIERGVIEPEAPTELPPPPPTRFPMADRIDAGQLLALFVFREHLPKAA